MTSIDQARAAEARSDRPSVSASAREAWILMLPGDEPDGTADATAPVDYVQDWGFGQIVSDGDTQTSEDGTVDEWLADVTAFLEHYSSTSAA